MNERKYTDEEVIKALDILAKLDFFEGTRAGRELWSDKPHDVQDKDILNFRKDLAFLKDFIDRHRAEIEELEAEIDKQYEQARADILGNMADGGTSCHWCIEQHQAKAVKEFAKTLCEGRVSNDPVVIAVMAELNMMEGENGQRRTRCGGRHLRAHT